MAEQAGQALYLWPTWGRADGYAALAQYVSTDALKLTPLAGAEQTLGAELTKEKKDRAVAQERFTSLQAAGIRYGHEPYRTLVSDRQQIRHPWWMTRDRIGTCVDLAVAYAAMCLEAEIAPLLAIDDTHAWVVLRPGAHTVGSDFYDSLEEETPVLPGTVADERGVMIVHDPDELAAAIDLLPLDAVCATNPQATFRDALREGAAGAARGVRLIDVAWLQTTGVVKALRAPTRERVGIRLYLPGGSIEVRTYGSRPSPEKLAAERGLFVLHGDQGSGKSTLARAAAARSRHGAAWFLDASNRRALIDSLARAELAELSEAGVELTDQTSEGYAYAALARLREATDPWLVVLDNADGEPATLSGLVPRPKGDQLVLVTTTNPAWRVERDVKGSTTLDPLSREEIVKELGRDDLVDLIGGRPLLLEAFRLLARHAQLPTPDASLLTEDALADRLSGPRAFWQAFRDDAVRDDAVERLCAAAALLPPDYQPVELLEKLAKTDHGFAELAQRGLFTWAEPSPTARLHRLFGEVIREDLRLHKPAVLDAAALSIAAEEDARHALDRHGESETTRRVAERLDVAADYATSVDEMLGTALRHVAWVLELQGDTKRSGELYARALEHLDENGRDEIVVFRADCLHGRARPVNQMRDPTEAQLEEAIGWAQDSQRLLERIGRSDRVGQPLAMEGLLLQKTARFAQTHEMRRERLREALDILVRADRLRGGLLPYADGNAVPTVLAENDPERGRSTFNLAGVRILLAKVEREEAAAHLDEAARVYAEVLRFRKRVYDVGVHPHIAACEYGLAVVSYYRALLAPASSVERTKLLRTAHGHGQEALRQREVLDGPEDLTDSQKTAEILAKIAAVRSSLVQGGGGALEPLKREILAELSQVDLEAVTPLTSETDPAVHVREWVTSQALGRLVEWFDGDLPREDEAPATALARLDEFSRIWDYRGDGRERNEAARVSFTGNDELLVDAACRALGLDYTLEPPRVEYDHVVVLGGLSRACLARPLAAARLIADGRIRTGSVVALGGFRKLGDSEEALLAELKLDGCECEFDVIDAGMRRAFSGYGAAAVQHGPRSRRSRLSGTSSGNAWRIHVYAADGRPDLRVVAAPAPSAQQRATTASTYAWLANDAGLLQRGQSVLIVTTHHYRPFQLADAICDLGLPLDLTVDAFGMSPGDYDARLAYKPRTEEYLQEVRSTIRSYRRLLAALTG